MCVCVCVCVCVYVCVHVCWYSFHSTRGSDMEYDPESYVEQSLPLLVVGTKLDQFPSSKAPPTTSLQGAVCMNVNCTDSRQFAIGSPDAIQFNKFFDKVTTACNVALDIFTSLI